MPSKKAPAVSNRVWFTLAVARVLLGIVFLWAFFDKLFGLKFATPPARAWLNGGSPTKGFLSHVEGPFGGFFQSMAGAAWADWLFMIGLLGIGVGLFFGIATRLAAYSGAVLLMLMWLASLPLENNPVVDDHVVYAVVLVALAFALPQQRLSIGGWWRGLPFVRDNRWLW